MKKALASLVVLMVMPAWGLAQEKSQPLYFEGLAFFEVQFLPNFQQEISPLLALAGGVGGEALSSKGPGFGVDYAKGNPVQENRLSANGYFGFPTTSKHKIQPFVTGGVTQFWVGSWASSVPSARGFNAGGGFNFWAMKHGDIRLELRVTHGGQAVITAAPNTVVSIRIGMAFK